jgi:hypothetical protein
MRLIARRLPRFTLAAKVRARTDFASQSGPFGQIAPGTPTDRPPIEEFMNMNVHLGGQALVKWVWGNGLGREYEDAGCRMQD